MNVSFALTNYSNSSKFVKKRHAVRTSCSGVWHRFMRKIQFIISIRSYRRHRQTESVHDTRVKMNSSFPQAHEIRDFNRTIRETLSKLPVYNLNETSNLLSLNDEQKTSFFLEEEKKTENSVFSHFCSSSRLISSHFISIVMCLLLFC